MSIKNLVFGQYVTSATFCLKLGKSEIAALARLQNAPIKDGTDPAIWALGSKGLISIDQDRNVTLTDAGKLALQMLVLAGMLYE